LMIQDFNLNEILQYIDELKKFSILLFRGTDYVIVTDAIDHIYPLPDTVTLQVVKNYLPCVRIYKKNFIIFRLLPNLVIEEFKLWLLPKIWNSNVENYLDFLIQTSKLPKVLSFNFYTNSFT